MHSDTIAAVATPAGTGGVAVIRISGDAAEEVLRKVFPRAEYEPGQMYYGSVKRNGQLLDMVLAVLFRAPKSYTGEDTAELHCHGSAVGVKNILEFVMECGARPAQPGEFTRRAFLNGKMDLSQAEAVCDFISASSQAGAKASLGQLAGKLKEQVLAFQDTLTDVLARVEAAVEYPEEDLEQEITQDVTPQLELLKKQIDHLADTFAQGQLAKEGMRVAIAGKPNVGKSSLMNALLGTDRAIVTDVAGTTRDTIEQEFSIEGISIYLTDTAGIRRTEDFIEKEGIKRSENAIKRSKLAVFVLDIGEEITQEDHLVMSALKNAQVDVIVVLNKLDASESLSDEAVYDAFGDVRMLKISAKEEIGIEELKREIFSCATKDNTSNEGLLITNARHRFALMDASKQIAEALAALRTGMDMDCVTIDLNAAWSSLGEITGKTVSEEIIDRIFTKFCLGK